MSKPPTKKAPIYIQIADQIIEQIENGELSAGDRLPPERNLSETFGVTRMTVRQALQVLEQQGLVKRRQGSGTFVSEPKIERMASKAFPFTKGIRNRGYTPGARIITFEQRPASLSRARRLGLAPGMALYRIHRLRFIDDAPVMLEKNNLPINLFPDLERFDLSTRSLFEVMETEYNIIISSAQQTLEAVAASEYEANLLQVPIGFPIMLESRIGYDQSGRPIEYAKDLYRGDRFRFMTEVAPLSD